MSDCPYYTTCNMFKEYANDKTKEAPLFIFSNLYCKGPSQAKCIRKKVADSLGQESVPVNLLPNGQAMIGTKGDGWPEDVKKLLPKA
ncbi:hypothetical protein JW826_00625 [Candidatus Woesearchaeota archaeon]|nr:hypothetical protein [Candidatus Woesearchaeota archaeon]